MSQDPTVRHRCGAALLLLVCQIAIVSCGGERATPDLTRLAGRIGPAGGSLRGEAGTIFDGVRLDVPPSALPKEIEVSISEVADDTPLPPRAEALGRQFQIAPDQTTLAYPATLTMAIDSDERRVRAAKPLGAVELWLRDGDGWMRAPSKTTTDQR